MRDRDLTLLAYDPSTKHRARMHFNGLLSNLDFLNISTETGLNDNWLYGRERIYGYIIRPAPAYSYSDRLLGL